MIKEKGERKTIALIKSGKSIKERLGSKMSIKTGQIQTEIRGNE